MFRGHGRLEVIRAIFSFTSGLLIKSTSSLRSTMDSCNGGSGQPRASAQYIIDACTPMLRTAPNLTFKTSATCFRWSEKLTKLLVLIEYRAWSRFGSSLGGGLIL